MIQKNVSRKVCSLDCDNLILVFENKTVVQKQQLSYRKKFNWYLSKKYWGVQREFLWQNMCLELKESLLDKNLNSFQFFTIDFNEKYDNSWRVGTDTFFRNQINLKVQKEMRQKWQIDWQLEYSNRY